MQQLVVKNSHPNNFGIMRLIFACLVIVSHSPEIIDGNRSREILTHVFGTMSFGEVAVDVFFIISGYLITLSFERTSTTKLYLTRRISRIVPGFWFCFLFCVLVIAPAGGGWPYTVDLIVKNAIRAIQLGLPFVPDAYQGLPYPQLDGSLWTIAYEFRCYLIVALLGLSGLFKGRLRAVIPAAAAVLLVIAASGIGKNYHIFMEQLLGQPYQTVRLTGVFLVGSSFYLFRDRIPLTAVGAATCGVMLVPLMFCTPLAEAAFAILGGYVVFWLVFRLRPLNISQLAESFDISYGMYLYAWPVQVFLVWHGIRNPWLLCLLTLLPTAILATLSWKLVEEPMKRFSHGRKPLATVSP